MKMIVGLGNPGEEYKNTHHNIGFMFVDFATSSLDGTWKQEKKFNAMTFTSTINNEKVIFVKPLTYMNLSGEAVLAIKNYYKIDILDILIIHDDMDLPFAKVRIRDKGQSAGHNGIKSIINCLQTQEVNRIRIGIDHPDKSKVIDYVLSPLSKEDKDALQIVLKFSYEMVTSFVCGGIKKLMLYNGFSFEEGKMRG